MSSRVHTLIAEITTALRTKSIAANLAYWNLATTGKAEEAKKAADLEKELRHFLSNPETFLALKQALNEPTGDALLDRQVVTLYNSYRENQLNEATINGLVEGANELEQIFSNFRGTINGEAQSDNAIREILAKSTNNDERKAAWQASKQIGGDVAPKLVNLVKLRNQAATRCNWSFPKSNRASYGRCSMS
jgi:peptidyl-dipeptidase A